MFLTEVSQTRYANLPHMHCLPQHHFCLWKWCFSFRVSGNQHTCERGRPDSINIPTSPQDTQVNHLYQHPHIHQSGLPSKRRRVASCLKEACNLKRVKWEEQRKKRNMKARQDYAIIWCIYVLYRTDPWKASRWGLTVKPLSLCYSQSQL